jgi:diguanylate cyclase (GGDEF)-like protein
MKLEHLRTLFRQLQQEFSHEGIACSVYYHFEGVWSDLQTRVAAQPGVITCLERARVEQVSFHSPSSCTAWFYLDDLECAVALDFPKSPRDAKRRKYRVRISKVKEAATNAYKVSHHSLTSLLARDAFRSELEQAISDLGDQAPSSAESQEGTPRTLALMALDIDHFKQVNDTWGHFYGDQVLKTFGIRLERMAEKIVEQGVGRPLVLIGHPSGEEFLIAIAANATRQQFADWANEFRTRIAEESLPTDQEWAWLSLQDDLSSLTPPPLNERAVAASIGVALYANVSPVDASTEPVSSLVDRADTALYRAKSAGRNQVTFFDDILSSCGRILEQDTTTRVVAIDIGSNVGVTIGQEFRVFAPTFTGKKKFSVSDGRTTRTLGTYPRVESARIVVFNTQPEISFAFVSFPEESDLSLELGSHLEAIPAGSIGHLLHSFSKYFPSTYEHSTGGGLRNLHDFIKANADDKAKPFAVVVRITHEAEHLRKYGSVALNQAIARLYRAAQVSFPAAKTVEVLDRGSICMVGTKAAYRENMVVNFINELSLELPELGLFAGVFCDIDFSAAEKGGDTVKPENAIEYARFAASDYGRDPTSRVRHFTPESAAAILNALREARQFETAYADFERLRSLGVETPAMLNIAGLIAGSLGMRKEAAEHYAAAMHKAPKERIFKSNFAIATERLGDPDAALKVLNEMSDEDVDWLHKMHPFGYFSYAKLLANARLSGSAQFVHQRFNRIAAEALKLPEAQKYPESKNIQTALATM